MCIELKNVSYIYSHKTPHEVKALSDVSLKIENGEFIGLVGGTGSGKSTLIQLIAALLTPSSGQILIDGQDINGGYDRIMLRNKVGIVFQNPDYQLFETTVERDVAFGLKHSGLDKNQIYDRVRQSLENVGLNYEQIKEKSPLSLSGGEKRKVAIAGVLAAGPEILIFDEPIAGLDPLARIEFLELVKQLNNKGTTVIMISHNIDAVCEYAKRVIVLCDGHIVSDGTPEEVFYSIDVARQVHLDVSNAQSVAQQLYNKGVISNAVITKRGQLVNELKAALKGGAGG